MAMKLNLGLKKQHIIGISAGILSAIIGFILWQVDFIDVNMFYFIVGIGIVAAGLPFFASLILEAQEERNKEQMFLEFTRDLVEGVKSGTPISKSILNLRTKNYGVLNKYVDKLANQIALGIPVKEALETFAKDLKSVTIRRAITLIREAERAGGAIESILESVVLSISQIEKLRKERRAAIYNLTVQGYIIFLIFIAIILVMQYKILPITAELDLGGMDTSGLGGFGGFGGGGGGVSISPEEMRNSFLFLLITQGFFAGLVIGKISEGKVKSGLKHSFVLVVFALLIGLGARAFLG